jgi:hypothetical protein
MQNDKQNLTKSQLAALDLLIAHMEENKGQPMSFIDSIVNAVTDVAHAVTNVATNATNVVTNAATDVANAVVNAAPAVVNVLTAAAPVVTALAQVAAATAVAINDPKALQAGGNPLQGLEKSMTLENLIKIRNQHTKK